MRIFIRRQAPYWWIGWTGRSHHKTDCRYNIKEVKACHLLSRWVHHGRKPYEKSNLLYLPGMEKRRAGLQQLRMHGRGNDPNISCKPKQQFLSSGKRQAYHWKFSFSKDETISAENALAFLSVTGRKNIWEMTMTLSVQHIPTEITDICILSSIPYRGMGKKYRYEKGDWQKVITPLTNKLADKYHTGCLKEKDSRQRMEETRLTGKKRFKKMDDCIRLCSTYPRICWNDTNKYGYETGRSFPKKHGVYLALKPPGKSKAVRSYQLDEGYMPPEIEKDWIPLSILPSLV